MKWHFENQVNAVSHPFSNRRKSKKDGLMLG